MTGEYLDPSLIQLTRDFLEKGRLEMPPHPFELSGRKQDVLDLIAKFKKQSPLTAYNFTLLQMTVRLGGVDIKLPPMKITMKNVILGEDVNDFEKWVSSFQDNKSMEFTLKPTTDENVIYEITESK